jgi:hypothetical protein
MWWRRLRYVLVLVALCAIATCPAAKRSCSARNHAREAEELLDYVADRVAAQVALTGAVPPLAAGPTPVPSGGACDADATAWSSPGWQQLGFSIDGSYRYTYQYLPDPSGASAVVRATGDLDCDGNGSLFELRLTVAGPIVLRNLTTKDPYE